MQGSCQCRNINYSGEINSLHSRILEISESSGSQFLEEMRTLDEVEESDDIEENKF